MIGKLRRKPLKKVFTYEAKNFTPWLRDNLDVLNDVLDLGLCNAEREASAGDFSVDLVAEDRNGHSVVIENQFGKSDHDHLGKLLTYLTAVEAKTAIWIVEDPRPEHIRAVTWLNETSPSAFYLLKAEAVSIEGSDTEAPLFTLIVGPSEELAVAGKVKKEIAEREDIRERFWTGLLKEASKKTRLHEGLSTGAFGWIGAGAGKSGLSYNYYLRRHDCQVELYLDRGKDSNDTKTIFEQLYAHKDAIEMAFEGPLEWQKLEERRACRIRKVIGIGGYQDEAKWPEIYVAAADAMCRLEKAMRPFIEKLDI